MLKEIKKDITEVTNGIVVHGCNCQGVMGSGAALAVKKRWLGAYVKYLSYLSSFNHNSKTSELLGEVAYYKENEVIVANCFTQDTFGGGGKKYASYSAVRKSLRNVLNMRDTFFPDKPIYVVKIGCLRGGLNWNKVKKDMTYIFGDTLIERPDNNVYICDL